MFEGMNGGGRPFWLALIAAVALAAVSSGAGTFPTPLAFGVRHAVGGSTPFRGRSPGFNSSRRRRWGPSTESTADVTFSFAVEVKRFDDGTVLEQDDLHRVTCRSASGDARWEIGMEGPLLGAYRFDANGDGTR